jgi:hypothetical protein
MKVTCLDWEAWYDQMPGADHTKLHVAGTCSLPSSSIQLTLQPGDPGVAPEDGVFVLELRATEPPASDTRMDERTVGWSDDVGKDIKSVRIIGDAEASVEVKEVH